MFFIWLPFELIPYQGLISVLIAILIPLSLRAQGNTPFAAQSSQIVTPHQSYIEISQIDGVGLWQPPLHPNVAFSQAPLIFQLYHGKKLLNGHAPWVDRVRPKQWDILISENQFLHSFYQFEVGLLGEEFSFVSNDIEQMKELGIDLLVLDDELFKKKDHQLVTGYEKIFTTLFGSPTYNFDGVKVWSVDKWNGVTSISTIDLPKTATVPSHRFNFIGPSFNSRMFIPPSR